jgi:hypothetical protein
VSRYTTCAEEQQLSGRGDVVGQPFELRKESGPPPVSGDIGEPEAVPPFDELDAGGSQLPDRPLRRFAAPEDDAVRERGHLHHRVHVGGGGVEDGEKIPGLRQLFAERGQDRRGEPVVSLGEFQDIEIPGQKSFRGGEGWEAVHVPGGDMEERPERAELGVDPGSGGGRRGIGQLPPDALFEAVPGEEADRQSLVPFGLLPG